jgi:predicted Zn-dependent protease
MSASYGVERVDLKRAEFCPACAQALSAKEVGLSTTP